MTAVAQISGVATALTLMLSAVTGAPVLESQPHGATGLDGKLGRPIDQPPPEPDTGVTYDLVAGMKSLRLRGPISSATARAIADHIGDAMGTVTIDSPGGDPQMAMWIGRHIRTAKLVTFVAGNARCSSACIYVLAGGTSRMVQGRVGIHRLDWTEQQQAARRNYFIEMNIAPELADRIKELPTEPVMHWLSSNELTEYGLHCISVPRMFRRADSPTRC